MDILWIITLVFKLTTGSVGVDSDVLAKVTPAGCDEQAAMMIENDLMQHPDATDFGWTCNPLNFEGYPPALFGVLPEGHPPVDAAPDAPPQPEPKHTPKGDEA